MTAAVAFWRAAPPPTVPRRYNPRTQPFAAGLAAALESYHAGDFEAALRRCEAIETAHGEQPWTQLLLLLALKERMGERAAALAVAHHIVQRWPSWIDGRYNLGAFLQEDGAWEEARYHLRRANAIDGHHVPTLVQLGICAVALGESPDHWWDEALSYIPRSVREEYQLSPIFASRGQMREFMRLQELRWEAQESYQYDHGAPAAVMAHAELWTGDSLEGQDLLVLDEQGAGDTLQFARYLPTLCDQARSVYLRLKQRSLARLLHAIEPRVQILDQADPMPLATRVVGLLSTFHRLAIVNHSERPFPQGYVPSKNDGGGRVGLCWAGAKTHPRDAQRSMAPNDVRRLLDACPGVEWLDFTFGRDPLEDPRVVPCPVPTDYLDTVQHLDRCRALVTVDTSVAHLAGAMGMPTKVMVTTLPDMRWGLSGEGTPWYDSWTLLRQEAPNDWGSVIHTIAREVAA